MKPERNVRVKSHGHLGITGCEWGGTLLPRLRAAGAPGFSFLSRSGVQALPVPAPWDGTPILSGQEDMECSASVGGLIIAETYRTYSLRKRGQHRPV